MDKTVLLSIVTMVVSITLLWNLYSFGYFSIHNLSVEHVTLNVAREENLEERKLLSDMLLWPSLVKSAHIQDTDISLDPKSADYQYLKSCWTDPGWFRMYSDPNCLVLWMRVLEHVTVDKIDNILPVVTKEERDSGASAKPQQNGGIRCYFDGVASEIGMRGYWKPCRSFDLEQNSESFASEIVAFHIDQILGFHRTPAVVPRVFSSIQHQKLAAQAIDRKDDNDKEAISSINSIKHYCGRDGNFIDGAMVGWSPKDIQLLSKHIDKSAKAELFVKFNSMEEEEIELLQETKFYVNSTSPQEEINWVLENVAVNLFAILTNNFGRFGHNLFIQTRENELTKSGLDYGPFIFIDNDRSKWKYDLRIKGKVPINPSDHPLATFCKFPENIANRLLLLESLADEGISLGKLVLMSTSIYEDTIPSGPVFNETQALYLDKSATYITDILKICISNHRREEVFLKESDRRFNFMNNIIQRKVNRQYIPEEPEPFFTNFAKVTGFLPEGELY